MGEGQEPWPLSIGDEASLTVDLNSQKKSELENEENQLTASQPAPVQAPTSAPLKHQSTEQSRFAGKTAPKAVSPFGRRRRSKIPQTWRNGQLMLLHDLECSGATVTQLRIARLQTDLRYPPMFPAAIDWDKYIPGWIERDWKDRRRTVSREIIPDLAAWCDPLEPFDTLCEEDRRRHDEQYTRLSRIVRSLPEMLITDTTPKFVAEKMAECSWELSSYPMLLSLGKMKLRDVTQAKQQAFFEVASLLDLAD